MTSNNSDNETESSASEPWTDNRPDAEISLEDELSLDNQQQESQDNATTTTEPLAPAPHTVLTSTATTPDLTTTNNEDDEDETPRFNISLDSNDTFSVPPAQSEPISGDTSVPTESSTTASTTFIHSTVTDPRKNKMDLRMRTSRILSLLKQTFRLFNLTLSKFAVGFPTFLPL